MPHAESTTTAVVNGEKSQSQFLSHLSSYPVVSDTISAYKSNPYGAKSLDLAAHAQSQYIDPVLASKQAKQASSYIHPYAAKADSLGEEGLKKVETYVPLIKEDTATVKDTVFSFILTPVTLPLSYARWGYDWVSETYAKEVKANGGDEGGLVAHGKAVVTTGLVAVGESTAYIRQLLAKAEKEGSAKAEELKEKLTKKGQEVKKDAKDAKKDAKKEINGST